MNFEDVEFMASGETSAPTPHKKTAYDIVKDILLPLAPVIGMLLSLNSTWKLILFFVLALIFAALGFYPGVLARRRRKKELALDDAAAVREFPRFLKLVKRFGEFVGTTNNETLFKTLTQDMSQNVRAELSLSAGGGMLSVWNGFWHVFAERLNELGCPDAQSFALTFNEFHHMVAQFSNLAVCPIFDRMSDQLRSALTAQDKSRLNGFQMRYLRFTDDFEAFGKELAQSRPAFEKIYYFVPHSNPL